MGYISAEEATTLNEEDNPIIVIGKVKWKIKSGEEWYDSQKNGYLIIPIPVQILFEKKANAFIKRFLDLRKECDMLLFIGKLK